MPALKIGISSLDVSALPVYAEARGAFAEAGIAVEIVRDLGHPDRVRDAVAAGELDAGYVDIVTALRAQAAQVPIEIVAPGGCYRAAAPIVVLVQAPTAKCRTASDLHGKVVVTPARHDLAQLGVRTWIDRNGGDSQQIHFRFGIPMKTASDVLAAGTADACIISEPQRTLQRERTALLCAPFDAIADEFIMGAYVASRRWIDAFPADARALGLLLRETARWANAHHAETAAMLAESLRFPPTIARTMIRATYADELNDALLAPVREAAVTYGLLSINSFNDMTV